jgi:hypothetical protein
MVNGRSAVTFLLSLLEIGHEPRVRGGCGVGREPS